jgi:hypothetical protein
VINPNETHKTKKPLRIARCGFTLKKQTLNKTTVYKTWPHEPAVTIWAGAESTCLIPVKQIDLPKPVMQGGFYLLATTK